jgi:CRISPR/Cas system CSM-associated protein Csm3 (group 7 of RAMP superfamily)
MPKPLWSGDESRKIVTRIVVEGELVLQTPARFGNGDTDDLTDMPLLIDPFDNKTPLLTGASIAGALRGYLRAREHGYGQVASSTSASVLLFGGQKGEEQGEQSPLIVDDALGKNFGIEMRDSVHIHPESRTAEEDKLFNLQLWQAGTTFPLRFELVIREDNDKDYADTLKRALATALAGFSNGSITLGARKRRGYGRVNVATWRVKVYDLTQPDSLLDWVEHGDEPLHSVAPEPDIETALSVSTLIHDSREMLHITMTCALDGSLLIRAGSGQDDRGPDVVHLHARQAGRAVEPILSGTSLGGVLRARALKIANTLGLTKAQGLIEPLFGKVDCASRLSVSEHPLQNVETTLVQNRVSLDRFTGGARDTALFNEQPVFGGDDTAVTVDMHLVNPQDYEIGLLLLLLKELWTGDLPLGGESGIGRGRLKGKRARLTLQHDSSVQTWEIIANNRGLLVSGDRNTLDAYVTKALKDYFSSTQQQEGGS